MKKVTLIIDDNYSDVITVTVVGVRGNMINVNTSAYEIDDGDVIVIDPDKEVQPNENY